MTLLAARLTPTYNCAHFLCDAWEQETGQSIRQAMACFLTTRGARAADTGLARSMQRLAVPQAPCIVLWRRRGGAPHVGLYSRRTVLHLTDSGPMRQLLAIASIGYQPPRFYAPRPHYI